MSAGDAVTMIASKQRPSTMTPSMVRWMLWTGVDVYDLWPPRSCTRSASRSHTRRKPSGATKVHPRTIIMERLESIDVRHSLLRAQISSRGSTFSRTSSQARTATSLSRPRASRKVAQEIPSILEQFPRNQQLGSARELVQGLAIAGAVASGASSKVRFVDC